MKKILFAILLFSPFYTSSQVVDYNHMKWTIKNDENYDIEYSRNSIIISDSIVEFTISPDSDVDLWSCKIKNNSSDKITIKWSEAAMGSYNISRILFGDIFVFNKNDEIPDATLYSGSYIQKDIGGEYYVASEYNRRMIFIKTLKDIFKKSKKPQGCEVTIVIPIEYGGNIKPYKIIFDGEYAGKIKR